MEGLLIYNGTGDHDEWYNVFFRTQQIWHHTGMSYLDKPDGPMSDSTKPYFKVGGPKCLIKW